MEIGIFLKRYWSELVIIFFLITILLLNFLIPFNIVIIGYSIIGYSIPLIIFLIQSIKATKSKTKRYALILNIIEEIFKDIHSFQNISDMSRRIYEKFENLENNFKDDLKEMNIFIENVEESKAIVIYLNEEKIIGRPGIPIIRKSQVKEQILKNYEAIVSLMTEIRKKF